jgi:activating signal cointegrator complex subunit 1
MQTSYKDFQNNVMESCGSDTRGLDETVFQTPSLLHLTIGTLALMDDMERKKAKEILESAIEEFKAENKITTCPPGFSNPPTTAVKLNIEIKGLEIMNDDPGEVDVVYG